MDVFPIEIIEEILCHLRPIISTTEADEADVKVIYDAWNWWSLRPVFPKDEEARIARHLEREYYYTGAEYVSNRRTGDPRGRYREILPLRLVNRAFRDICTPFVYQEMTLFDWTDETTHYVANQYGRHIHSLRIMFRRDDSAENENSCPEDRLLHILSLCPETRSITFYHFQAAQSWLTDPTWMMSAILKLKKLDTIGTYIVQKFEVDFRRLIFTTRLIETVAQSDMAASITRLNISIPILNRKLYNSLLSSFISLEHLSLYGSFYLFRTANPVPLDWSAFRHLTSLNIAGENPADRIFSNVVPEFVRTCTSLKRLFISDHGTAMGGAAYPDWTTKKDGWWDQRTPLEYFQLHVATRRTALIVGSIPVREMRLIIREDGHFDGLFSVHKEVFPYLQVLTIRSGHVRQEYGSHPDVIWTKPLCRLREERGIALRFEGIPVDHETRRRETASSPSWGFTA